MGLYKDGVLYEMQIPPKGIHISATDVGSFIVDVASKDSIVLKETDKTKAIEESKVSGKGYSNLYEVMELGKSKDNPGIKFVVNVPIK